MFTLHLVINTKAVQILAEKWHYLLICVHVMCCVVLEYVKNLRQNFGQIWRQLILWMHTHKNRLYRSICRLEFMVEWICPVDYALWQLARGVSAMATFKWKLWSWQRRWIVLHRDRSASARSFTCLAKEEHWTGTSTYTLVIKWNGNLSILKRLTYTLHRLISGKYGMLCAQCVVR